MPSNSTDVCKEGALKRYTERPKELEDKCLADFIALYDFTGTGSQKHRELEDEDETEKYQLIGAGGTLYRRNQPKIISFRQFDINEERDFYRERLMLFKPWKNEEEELEEHAIGELKSLCEEFSNQITENAKKYIKNE